MAIFNFFGLLTFSYRAVFPVVFVSTLTLVTSFAVFNCNYSVLSHYCPELLSAEDYVKGAVARVSGEAGHNYSLFKGAVSRILSFQLDAATLGNWIVGGLSTVTVERLESLTWPFEATALGVAVLLVAAGSCYLYENGRSVLLNVANFLVLSWVAYNFGALAVVVAVGLCLRMLESLVCAVQAYVFYALSVNYSRS